MNNKGSGQLIVLLFLTLLVVILSFVFLLTKETSAAEYPLPSPSEQCNTLSYNGDGVDIVFFATEEQTREYSEYLLDTPPFNEYKQFFNIYYITKPIECGDYKGIATFCHSKELIQDAGACPHDYILVLTDAGDLRSSAYQGVGSININHPKTVLTHEFGHLSLFLDEEYTPASPHANSVNCKESCDEFDNPDGCYEGCSRSNLMRSIQNGVMRTLRSNDYGVHNEQALEEWLVEVVNDETTTITGNQIAQSPVAQCFDQTYYYITTDGANVDKELFIGCSPKLSHTGPQNAVVVDKNNQQVLTRPFTTKIFTEEPGEEVINNGAEGVFEEPTKVFAIPEVVGANQLEIFDESGAMAQSISLSDIGRYPCIIA